MVLKGSLKEVSSPPEQKKHHHQEFQVLKMEVLNYQTLFFGYVFLEGGVGFQVFLNKDHLHTADMQDWNGTERNVWSASKSSETWRFCGPKKTEVRAEEPLFACDSHCVAAI